MKLMQQNRNLVDRDENTMVRFEVGIELGAFKVNVESQYNTYKTTEYFLTYLADVIISLQDRLKVLADILSNTSDLKIVEALEITDDIRLAYNDKKYIMTIGRYIDLMFAVSETKDRLRVLVNNEYIYIMNDFNKEYKERKDYAGYTYQMNERIYNLLQILRNQIEAEIIKLEKCE